MNFFERYCILCKEQGSTPNGVAKKLGVASASVTQWKQGSVPRVETLARIADYFGVTVEYLTGCLLYTSPSPRDIGLSRMPSSA